MDLNKNIKNEEDVEICQNDLFQEGFGKFLKNGKFFDAILVHEPTGAEYNIHRILLANKSKFFEMLFTSCFMEKKKERIHVKFKDPDNVFPNILEYLYKGNTKIDPSKLIALRIASDQLMFFDLSENTTKFISTYINHSNIFSFLLKSIEKKDDSVLSISCEYLAKFFMELVEKETLTKFEEKLFKIPFSVVFQIIGHEQLIKNNTENIPKRNKIISELIKKIIEKNKGMENKEFLSHAIDAMVNSACLTVDDAVMYLVKCEKLGMKTQAKGCAELIASQFYNIKKENDFMFKLQPDSFYLLINSDSLKIESEDKVLHFAQKYIEKNPNLDLKTKQKIMSAVRICFLSQKKLLEIKDNKEKYCYLPRKELLNHLFIRIRRLENDEINNDNLPSNQRKRGSGMFEHQSDFDTNGILYWLGTKRGKTKTWQCPITAGEVDVSNHPNFEAGSKTTAIGRVPASCNLVAGTNSYIAIEFKKCVVLPTKYTLRHTNSRDNEALRNWKFQGSNDNVKWVDLSVHTNDASLNVKSATKTFKVNSSNTSFFKRLRILQTGNNSSNSTYFSMAGFEVYGSVQ